jgi:hypothetical protein
MKTSPEVGATPPFEPTPFLHVGQGPRQSGNSRGSEESLLIDSSHRNAMAERIRKEQ